MRILVVGAGAVGGYFGGRLLQAGRDVTLLVRHRRAAELTCAGLVIKSPHGDVTLREPRMILSENLCQFFDLVLLCCKAYDLPGAVASIVPAVGPETMILPLLNGMRHLDILDERFGRSHVLGGQCIIAATLDDDHTIVHLNNKHTLSFGERDGHVSDRVDLLADVLADANFDARPSEQIMQEMWEKWVFLATLAGVTCLMRATVGDILAAPRGKDLMLYLLKECCSIAEVEGYVPRPAFLQQIHAMLTTAGSPLTASMLRDMEGNSRIEADHIAGDLLHYRRAESADHGDISLLRIAYTHMKAYEARRIRTLSFVASQVK